MSLSGVLCRATENKKLKKLRKLYFIAVSAFIEVYWPGVHPSLLLLILDPGSRMGKKQDLGYGKTSQIRNTGYGEVQSGVNHQTEETL
jgi:hypothetical protein